MRQAKNAQKVLPDTDVPVRELHHCLQRKGPSAQQEKYVSELITFAVCGGYFCQGVVWCVAEKEGHTMYDYMRALASFIAGFRLAWGSPWSRGRTAAIPMNGNRKKSTDAKL